MLRSLRVIPSGPENNHREETRGLSFGELAGGEGRSNSASPHAQGDALPLALGRGRCGLRSAEVVGMAAEENAVRAFEVAPAPTRRRRRRLVIPKDEDAGLRIPSAPVYSQLLSFERRLDAVLATRRSMVQECIRKNKTETTTLRVFVFSSTDGGGADAAASGETWTLHIHGRLLGPNDEPLAEHLSRDPPFSSFVRRMEVSIGDERAPCYPGPASKVVWESSLDTKPSHGFEIKRHGVGRDVPVTVRLEMRHHPERLRLSAPLAALLGRDEDTKAHVVHALWEYIKMNARMSANESGAVLCDAGLKAIFHEDSFPITRLPLLLDAHLSYPPPVEVKYVVPGPRSGGAKRRRRGRGDADEEDDSEEEEEDEEEEGAGGDEYAQCCDVKVSLPGRTTTEGNSFIDKYSSDAEVARLDQEIRDTVSKIQEHSRRRDFFLGFSDSPHDFIRDLTVSQARDLQVLASDDVREVESRRRTSFYRRAWAADAALRFLHRENPDGANDMPE